MSEKQNDIIECCIRAFTNYQQDDWDQFLPDFELAINASKNGSSGLSPQELDTGIEPFLPLAVVTVPFGPRLCSTYYYVYLCLLCDKSDGYLVPHETKFQK